MVPGFAVANCAICRICRNWSFWQISQNRRFWGFGQKPRKTPKNPIFGPSKKGAQSCGGSRRIIYCLDTRYGPQTTPPGGEFGGFPDPPDPGGVSGPVARNAGFRISPKSGISGFCMFRILHRIRNSGFGFLQFQVSPSGHPLRDGSRGKLAAPNFRDSNIAK